MSEDSSATPIPPWRDKSLSRITTTKTDGLMSHQPSQGVKQKFEGLFEALSRKHAMEYAVLIEEYEEMARPPEKKQIKKKRQRSRVAQKNGRDAFSDDRLANPTCADLSLDTKRCFPL